MKRLTAPVLERMEADHAQTPARRRAARRACGNAASSDSSSSLTRMRSAWNVRVAGCLPGSRVGTARGDQRRRAGRVRSIGASRPRRTIARAMRRAKRSSPSAEQRVGDLALAMRARSHCAAVWSGLVVHPHVERSILHEAEAALGCVELRRRNTEIEQHAVQLPVQPCLADAARRVVANDPLITVRRGSCAELHGAPRGSPRDRDRSRPPDPPAPAASRIAAV